MALGRLAYPGQGRRNLPVEPSEQIRVCSGSYPGRLRAGPTGLLRLVSIHLPTAAADFTARQEAAAVAAMVISMNDTLLHPGSPENSENCVLGVDTALGRAIAPAEVV